MRFTLVICLILTPFLITPARADSHDELLARVQAADLLCDLLTWNSDHIAAHVDGMRQYLKDAGKLDAFDHRAQPTSMPSAGKLFYNDLFDATVKFVKTGGDKYSDPALKNLDDMRLLGEFSTLLNYDVQQFLYLKQKREEAIDLKTYLESTGQLAAYTKWASDKGLAIPATGTTRPSELTPDQIVQELVKKMSDDHAVAWKKAQAGGMSEADFEKQWNQKTSAFKTDVTQQINGMGALSTYLDESQPMSAPQEYPPTPVPANLPPLIPGTWNRMYRDPWTTTYQGPGIYESNDRRLELDNDQRVNGEYDRRNALGFDRRQTIRIYIRKGV